MPHKSAAVAAPIMLVVTTFPGFGSTASPTNALGASLSPVDRTSEGPERRTFIANSDFGRIRFDRRAANALQRCTCVPRTARHLSGGPDEEARDPRAHRPAPRGGGPAARARAAHPGVPEPGHRLVPPPRGPRPGGDRAVGRHLYRSRYAARPAGGRPGIRRRARSRGPGERELRISRGSLDAREARR